MAQLQCLRCGAEMRFAGQEKLQLGKTGWLSGIFPISWRAHCRGPLWSARTAESWSSSPEKQR